MQRELFVEHMFIGVTTVVSISRGPTRIME